MTDVYNQNPEGYPCKRCGKLAERFCYDIQHKRLEQYCNWFCLQCEPYDLLKIF